MQNLELNSPNLPQGTSEPAQERQTGNASIQIHNPMHLCAVSCLHSVQIGEKGHRMDCTEERKNANLLHLGGACLKSIFVLGDLWGFTSNCMHPTNNTLVPTWTILSSTVDILDSDAYPETVGGWVVGASECADGDWGMQVECGWWTYEVDNSDVKWWKSKIFTGKVLIFF